MTPDPTELASLRRQIAEIDRALAESIGARLALARRVAEEKAKTLAATRDFEVEAQVLERWRRALAATGIAGGRAEAFARWLIEESVRVQAAAPVPRPGPTDRDDEVTVVGGAGAMGRWLVRFFEDAGRPVAVVDPRATAAGPSTYPDVETASARTAVLVFATPIRSTAPLLARALDGPGDPLIFDVLSVKEPIAALLRRGAGAGKRVASVHPMFGPSARTLSGRNLLLVSCGVAEADRAVRRLFAGTALSVAEIPLDRHDRLIAESLGLAHAVNLLFLSALAVDPASPHDLARAASTTFHRQSTLARNVAEEGAELYLDIQALNPHSRAVYRQLTESLDALRAIVEREDLPAFAALLRDGSAKLETGPEPMRS